MDSYFFESSLVVGLPVCLFMTSTRSLAREFDNSLDVGLPMCFFVPSTRSLSNRWSSGCLQRFFEDFTLLSSEVCQYNLV